MLLSRLRPIGHFLGRNKYVHRAAMCAGLPFRARRTAEVARQAGAKLVFRWNHIRWSRGKEVILFPPFDPDFMIYYLGVIDGLYPRMIFRPQGKWMVADCRGPAQYRMPSGRISWLPTLPEPIDFLSGYFAQGKPQPGQIAVDAGAYCGEMTLELADCVGPTGRVFAFEPDPKNIHWLEKNLQANGLKNVTIVPKGLWNKTTTLQFVAAERPDSSLVESEGPVFNTGPVVRVDVLSPEDAFALIGRVPDFIKMDIEGAEVEVIDAMEPLLKTAPILLAIASYHLRNGRKTHEIITPVLERAGLQVTTGYEQHLTTWARRV